MLCLLASLVHSSPIMLYLLAIPLLLLSLQSLTAILFIKNAIVHAVLLLVLLLQELWRAIRYLHTVTHDRGGTATRFCKAVLLGASEAIWSIWSLEDRFMARLFSASNPAPNPSGLTSCAGYTDKGRCDRHKSLVDGGVWYCWQHKRQDARARM